MEGPNTALRAIVPFLPPNRGGLYRLNNEAQRAYGNWQPHPLI
jgi:hypothetical protein